MNSKKVAAIGYGYVGKAMVDMVKGHYDVIVYDPKCSAKDNFDNVEFSKKLQSFKNCFLGIVCVPTSSNKDRTCNTNLVEETVNVLETEIILIKSTIAPGTTDKLKKETRKRIVFSPEYVGQSKYYNPYFSNDMKAVPFFIVERDEKDYNFIFNAFIPILGPTKQYYKTSALNVELIK